MKPTKEAYKPKKMMNVRLDPRFQGNKECNEQWKEHKVANSSERKICDRRLPQVREWESADIQEEDVGEQEGDADGNEELIHCGRGGPQAGRGERMKDENCSQANATGDRSLPGFRYLLICDGCDLSQ
jgi:hypothetical protein